MTNMEVKETILKYTKEYEFIMSNDSKYILKHINELNSIVNKIIDTILDNDIVTNIPWLLNSPIIMLWARIAYEFK